MLVIFDSAGFDLRVNVPAKRTNTSADPNTINNPLGLMVSLSLKQ